MSGSVRVAVIGHGYFGGFHAKHYESHPGAELVAIVDPSEASADLIREKYGERHCADHTELFGRVDAVSIAAPTARHEALAGDFIKAGVHVLVEKPLCATAAAGQRLDDLAAGAGTILNVGHIERFSPTYQRLRQEMAATPKLVECRRHAPWRGRIVDVDVVLDMMIHDIDLVLDLTRSEPVEVSASGVDIMGFGLDVVLARIEFANGVAAHISANRVAANVARTIEIAEASRTLAADLGAGKLSLYPAEGSMSEIEIPHRDALRGEIDAFLAAVRGEENKGVVGSEALAALRLAERIIDAAG